VACSSLYIVIITGQSSLRSFVLFIQKALPYYLVIKNAAIDCRVGQTLPGSTVDTH
jgi:hypothetical protein